jgi:hypothetical protein
MSTVDVVILVYNNIEHIDNLFESLDGQFLYINKLILSSDETSMLNLNYACERLLCYNNLKNVNSKFFFRGENLGVAMHIASLQSEIESDLVLFIGADDYLHEEYFKRLIPFFESDGIVAVTPNQFRVNGVNKLVSVSNFRHHSAADLCHIISTEDFIVPSAGTLLSREVVRETRFTQGMANDDDQLLFVASLLGRRIICEENLFYYRVGSDSLSSWLRKPFERQDKFVKLLLHEYENRKLHNTMWLRQLIKHVGPSSSQSVKIIENRIKQYEKRISIVSNSRYAFILTVSVRAKLLYYLVRFKVNCILNELGIRSVVRK